MNEGNPFQIDLTFEVELEITLNKIECKKIKKPYELNHTFQNVQAIKLPWENTVLNEDKLVTHVQCKICTKVMGKKKFFVPKFDYFCKHVGRKKVTSPMLGVPKGTFYYAKDC